MNTLQTSNGLRAREIEIMETARRNLKGHVCREDRVAAALSAALDPLRES